MLRVSLVGHSQTPKSLQVSGAEIRIFRAPGGRADSFFEDSRMNNVLGWKHDLCLLWIGSNDIADEIEPNHLAETIKYIVQEIEDQCEAEVCVCLVEPRLYDDDGPISREDYKKVQNAVNKKLKRELNNQSIHFNTTTFVEELASDGVHWTSEGRERVENKIITVIESHLSQ